DILRFQLLNELFSFMHHHRANRSGSGVAGGKSHFSFKLGLQEIRIVLGNRRRRYNIRVVAHSHISLAIDRPVEKLAAGFLFGVWRILAKRRRRIWSQHLVLAHVSQNRQSSFYRVGQEPFSLGLRNNFGNEVYACAAIGLYANAGILCLKTFSELFVRAARKRCIPYDFAFRFGAREQALLSVGAGVSGQLSEGIWLLALRPPDSSELQ